MASAVDTAFPPAGTRRDQTGGLPVLAGRLGFGALSVVLMIIWRAWDALGTPFGPGFAALAAYFLFATHVFLLRKRVSPFDPVVWVPVSMLMFYFGLPVAVEIFDSPLGYDAWQIGVPANLEEGFCVLLLAFTSFLWGIHLAGLRDLSRPLPSDAPRDNTLAVPALMLTIGSLLMIVFGVALVGPSVVFGYYDEWWAAKGAGADPRFIDAGTCFTLGGIYALLASDDPRQKWRRWLAYGAAAAIALVAINKGDRSGLIALSIGSGWCYSQRIRRVPPAVVASLAVFAILLMPVLQEFRDWKSVEGSRETPVSELAADAFLSMGSSALAVIFTEDLVPKNRDYALGVTFLDAFLLLVPNFGLTPGRSWGFDPYKYAPSLWLVEQLSPEWAAQGGGYGFAMAAEWYWNFGPLGLWLGITFLGWFMARVRNASTRSALLLAWSALVFAAMTIYVRNSLGYPLKFATWPAFGLWALWRLTRALGGPRAVPRAAQPGGIGAAPDRRADAGV